MLDRSYGSSALRKETSIQAQPVDVSHIRKLFDSLLDALNILQIDAHENFSSKRKINKALAAFPCGFVNIEEVATVPLRLLRINSSSNPKQARADKKLYDQLINDYLQEFHCLSWQIFGFLFKNVEMGTEIFERELASLVRDQIKNDMKSAESSSESSVLIGKGSECSLNNFNQLLRESTSFNGQVFIVELISSGILIELSNKALRLFASILRTGLNAEKKETTSNKKTRYHQAIESDQKKLEMAQAAFAADLERTFSILSRTFCLFESSQGHINPQNHVMLSENILTSVALLSQAQHNYKFVPQVAEGEYLRVLVESLSFAVVSFQPAYLPPFLPLAMRLLSTISSRSDAAGLTARKALLQVDLMIHPRRLGPVTYRPASETIIKVFERDPVEVQVFVPEKKSSEPVVTEIINQIAPKNTQPAEPQIAEPEETQLSMTKEPQYAATKKSQAIESQSIKPVEPDVIKPALPSLPVETLKPLPPSTQLPVKRSAPIVSEEDDEPLPQIVESGPDDI